MKKYLLFTLLISSMVLSAQDNKEVFKSYKYRFQKYRSLNTNFTLVSNQVSNDNVWTSSSRNNSSSSTNLNGGIYYFRNINTEQLQQVTSASSGIFYYAGRSFNSFNTYASSNGSSFNVSFNQQNRWYHDNHFLELNYGISNSDGYHHDKNAGLNKYASGLAASVDLKLGVGTGRLEMVGDVAQAMFILSDLKTKGIITNYTNQDIEKLAKEITHIYNTRIIDFRYKLRGQLGMLDDFFKSSGLLDKGKSQSTYFISLVDNWLNNNYVQRFSGNRFSYGITYNNNYRNTKTYQELPLYNYLSNRTLVNYFTPGLYANYIKEKAISLHWQKSMSIHLSASKYYYSDFVNLVDTHVVSITSNKLNLYFSQISATYKLSWYPNSRTYMDFAGTATISYNPENFKSLSTTSANLYLSPWVNLFYFVSPKMNFRVSMSPSFNFSRTFSPSTSLVRTQLPGVSAGLSYYIY